MSRRVLGIAAGAVVVILLLWYLLLWKPTQSKISDAKDRRSAAEAQVSQLRVTLSRLQELKRTEALKRSQIEALRVAVPDQPNLAQFILDANDAANKAGIEFLSITPSPPAAGAGGAPSSMNLSMSLTGGYFQILDFLNRLNDLPRLVVIDTLSMSGGQGDSLSVSVTARMFTTATPGATTPTTAPATATPTTVAGGASTTTTAGTATSTTGAP